MMMAIVVIIVVVIVAALFMSWLAAIAILLASFTTAFAAVPDGIGNYVEMADWFVRVIAVNHKLARSRDSLLRNVLNHQIEKGTRAQNRREWIIDQAEMTPLALEPHVGDVQVTLAGVAQRQNALLATAAFDAAKHGRAGDRQLARRHQLRAADRSGRQGKAAPGNDHQLAVQQAGTVASHGVAC